MSKIHDKLVIAAIETFTRFGFRRASMADIAAAAGVSRPTLYARFSSKEELLAAAIETQGQKALEALKRSWQGAVTPRQVLDMYCEDIILAQFDMIESMPEAQELFSSLTESGQRALEHLKALYAAEVLDKLRMILGRETAEQEQLVGFFIAASKGLKHVAADRASLAAQLSLLTELLAAQLENG